jgi:hypothetical protein
MDLKAFLFHLLVFYPEEKEFNTIPSPLYMLPPPLPPEGKRSFPGGG